MAKKYSEKQEKMAQARKEQRREAIKAQRKKAKQKKIAVATISIAAAAAVIAGISVWAVRTSPLTHLIPVKKTEHYALNAAELSFYSWQIYQQYMQNVTDSSVMPNADTPLSEQNYDGDTTWEEYFAQAGSDYADNVLVLCEAAYAVDFEPDYDLREEAENGLATLDISTVPDFVKEEDILTAMELYLLAWEYHTNIEDNFTLPEDELEAYYEENAESMQVCSYMTFGFSYSDSGEGYLTQDEAKDLALELRRCTTREAFEQWVVDYYMENTSISEEDARENAQALYAEDMSYIAGDAVSEWAFSDEASVGSTQVIDDTDTSTVTVCLLLSEPERDTTHPIDLRQIMFTANTYGSVESAHSQAEEILAQWEASDKTEESFAALANTYSEDSSAAGGLYTDVIPSEMITSWKQWFLAPERQTGDVTILDNSYGAFLVYYVDQTDTTSWELTATEALKQDHYDEMYTQWETDADVKTFSAGVHLIHVLES